MAWADAGLSPQYSTERTLRQKKGLWELFQNECVQISASLICHSKETQNEFKYHPLRIWSMSNTAPKWFKKNNGAHLPYNSPVGCYQQIKNSDAFFFFNYLQICAGENPKSLEQNTEMIVTTTSPPSFLIPFLLVFAPVHMLYSDCQDNNLVSSANRIYLSKIKPLFKTTGIFNRPAHSSKLLT